MMGNDLIVEIPWIVFGVLLAAVCLRLRRFRSSSGRSRGREAEQLSDEGNERPAQAGEPAGNEHHGAAVSSSSQPSQTRP